MKRIRREAATWSDYRRLRLVMTLVPWPMRNRLLLVLISAIVVSALDMAAVAGMLPLIQLLTSDALPPVVQDYLVPVLGTDDRQDLLIGMGLLIGSAFLVKNVALVLIRWWSLGITKSAMAAAQSEILSRYVRADYEQHRRRSRATILQAISDSVPTTLGAVLLGYVSIITDLIMMVTLLILLAVLAPEVTVVVAVLFGGAALLLARVLRPHARRLGMQALELNKASWRQLNPAIEGFRETRIFRREEMFIQQYRENRSEYARVVRTQGILGELPKHVLEIVMITGIIVVAMTLFALREPSVAFGLLAVFAAATMRIIPALNRFVATLNGVRTGRPSLEFVVEQILELAGDRSVVDDDEDEPRQFVPSEDIVVQDLSYRYPDGTHDVLQGVDVTIRRGSTVALVGSSGAGKTTFADLLTGLIRPTTGTITVGDLSVAEEPRRWMSELAVVSQRVYLWDAPIRDLITFGQPPEQVDAGLLEEVVRRARLDDLITELPEGLDNWVGDGGARLSGGQVQRIGIARALYAEPRVLILDEATSSLDNETEYEITRTIDALKGNVTVLVIAHRLSTVKNADEILFFSGGRLKDRGSMRELVARQPEFDRLVQLGSLSA